jgi:hypothetical protein
VDPAFPVLQVCHGAVGQKGAGLGHVRDVGRLAESTARTVFLGRKAVGPTRRIDGTPSFVGSRCYCDSDRDAFVGIGSSTAGAASASAWIGGRAQKGQAGAGLPASRQQEKEMEATAAVTMTRPLHRVALAQMSGGGARADWIAATMVDAQIVGIRPRT